MTTENNPAAELNVLNDDGETSPQPASENAPPPASVVLNDDGDFSAQFANLEGLANPDEEIATGDTNKADDGSDTDAFDGGANGVDTKIQSEMQIGRPGMAARDPSARYMSLSREGNFGDQITDLGLTGFSSPSSRPARRPSFSLQLQHLENLEETDSESISTSNAGSLIDHRMRRSSLGASLSKLFGLGDLESLIDEDNMKNTQENEATTYEEYITDPVFDSRFQPDQMRCLALVAHNHMKPAMKTFVMANKNLLCKFKLTGTNTTMTMLREVFGDDASVKFGPTCTSGPLGGDAELVAIMCTENLGGCIFFQDPMSAHPHAADIECLSRQANVHNVLMMPNPATAYACMESMRIALKDGRAEIIPSFFKTLQSPSVAEYKVRQARVVKRNAGK